ncbi:unnamed protein product, partial [Timema podura]|nr:unnamed protein product [Timema podura]
VLSQLCAPGYYRDSNDRSASLLGSCTRCPCNNHEESCSATPDGRVSCSCQSGYTGRYCNSVGEAAGNAKRMIKE